MEKSAKTRALISFWILGLCNNFAYVIMLSAAEDILERQKDKNDTKFERSCENKLTSRHCSAITTGAVLLADIFPCFLIKLTFPFFIQRIPFGIRHLVICLLQALSYFIVAFSKSVTMSLIGVGIASISSGFGEITYLALTPYFDKDTISTWSSGTGGAGIIGALAYAVLTEPHLANLSPRVTLLIMLIVPIIFAAAFWCILVIPRGVHRISVMQPKTWIVPDSSSTSSTISKSAIDTEKDEESSEKQEMSEIKKEISTITSVTSVVATKQRQLTFVEMIFVTIPLLRFMIPLMLVYLAEYLINQGIVQFIFFECSRGWSLSRASQYRWYQVLYQVGVFISRSSANIVQLPLWALVLLPIFQSANVLLFFFEALHFFIPHIWIIFLLILFEGLFGGGAYVNTFVHIHNFAKPDVREFSMSISSLGDSVGIMIAGFLSIPLHNYVCSRSLPRSLRA